MSANRWSGPFGDFGGRFAASAHDPVLRHPARESILARLKYEEGQTIHELRDSLRDDRLLRIHYHLRVLYRKQLVLADRTRGGDRIYRPA